MKERPNGMSSDFLIISNESECGTNKSSEIIKH
jgi:hypothetical protein